MEFKLKELKTDVSVSRIANIHYFEFTKEYYTFKDSHPFKELVYVDSGTIYVESEGYCGTLNSKQLLIHKSNEIHSLSCTANEAPNVIIIGFECNCRELDFFSKNPITLSNDSVRILTEIIKEGHSVFLPPYDVPNVKDMKKRTNCPFGAEQMLKLKLELLLIEIVRSITSVSANSPEAVNDKKIEDIYTYINEHYREKITLDNLCFLFATNKTTICNNFKKTYGETMVNYINRLRIKNAKKLIREGDYNLTELSAMLGFSSIHYFSNVFKSYENKSPSEYIDTIKSKLNL